MGRGERDYFVRYSLRHDAIEIFSEKIPLPPSDTLDTEMNTKI
jgi:hypothetical protein